MSEPDLSKPRRLLRRSHFWELLLRDDQVLTRHGKGSGLSGGRETARKFPDAEHALKWARDAFATKLAEGYLPPDEFQKLKDKQKLQEQHAQHTEKDKANPQSEHDKQQQHAQQPITHAASQHPSASVHTPEKQKASPSDSNIRRSGRKRTAPAQYVAESASRPRPRRRLSEPALHTDHSPTLQKPSSPLQGDASKSLSEAVPQQQSPTVQTDGTHLATPPARNLAASPRTPTSAKSRKKPGRRPGRPGRLQVGGKSPAVKKQRRAPRSIMPPIPENASLGFVDQSSGVDNGSIYAEKISSGQVDVFDVLLVYIDKSTQTDKFIVLQLIHDPTLDSPYILFEKSGRTGSAGQSLRIDFATNSLHDARAEFLRRFHDYTALSWQTRNAVPIPGKYRFANQDYDLKFKVLFLSDPHWQYWVDEGDSRKPKEWLDYNEEDSMLAEELHMEFSSNPWLAERFVQNGSHFDLVNLETMTTTQVGHPNSSVHHFRRATLNEKRKSAVDGGTGSTQPSTVVAANQATSIKATKEADGQKRTGSSVLPHVPQASQAQSQTPTVPSITPSTIATAADLPAVSEVPPIPTPHIAMMAMPAVSRSAVMSRAFMASSSLIPQTTSPTGALQASLVQAIPAVSGAIHAASVSRPFARRASQARSHNGSLPIPVDPACPSADQYKVVDGWDANLSGTDVIRNSYNRLYRIQLLLHPLSRMYFVWTRNGKEEDSTPPHTQMLGPFSSYQLAQKAFQQTFREKTGSEWAHVRNRATSVEKGSMLRVDGPKGSEPLFMSLNPMQQLNAGFVSPTLPGPTKDLINLLFDAETLMGSLKQFEIDIRLLPLIRLTAAHVQQGVAVLEQIQSALAQGTHVPGTLEQLSSKFYSIIPHGVENGRPPVILSGELLQRCYDMCIVLFQIVQSRAITLLARKQASELGQPMIPLKGEDLYRALNVDLKLVLPGSEEYVILSEAFHQTRGAYSNSDLDHIWRVERPGDVERFARANLINHALLWHGCHIGSVPSILQNGLQIVDHSGGRLGKGIYCSSESGKCLQTTVPEQRSQVGCMFLVEAALGRSYEVFEDHNLLLGPPPGYNSVRACGRQAPAGYKTVRLDNMQVSVAIMGPQPQMNAAQSSFSQDEFVVYDEAQVRLRYLVTFKKK
ncbi:Poly [ADP-ribose] polymerase 3 [Gracilariopsis chorda]|uniref:Poly [ADP-ribose] polymerase n=1 Tax=Gracilariopsis chorda TaxID=448386 RepID=A0A2V3J027_9FLOR|nr:Poly [ADP-ribose] polymerase 3 [Gracilariopsis chorda]|eukprot:PXF47762.1 Poly [ADP-ribose] polymerase 3 [Gracilariopsis chorda]